MEQRERGPTRKLYEEREVDQLLRDETYRTRVGVVLSTMLHEYARANGPIVFIETIKDVLRDYGFPVEEVEPPQPAASQVNDEKEIRRTIEETRGRPGPAGTE